MKELLGLQLWLDFDRQKNLSSPNDPFQLIRLAPVIGTEETTQDLKHGYSSGQTPVF